MRRRLMTASAAALMAAAVPAYAQDDAAASWQAGDWSAATAIWAQRAAEGDLDAQYNLAQAYRMGKGVPQSQDRAVEYYRSAATAGHKDAAEQLGLIYYDTPETRRAAVELLRALAAEGRPRAAYVVGLEHMSGQILPRDAQAARYYLKIAADGGVPMAVTALQQLPPETAAAPAPVVEAAAPQASPVAQPAELAPSPPVRSEAQERSDTPSGVSAWNVDVLADEGRGNAASVEAAPAPAETSASENLIPVPAAPSAGTGRWGIWFGPYRNHVTAGVKFTRIAARARFEDGARFVPVEDGIRVEYGAYGEAEARELCESLSRRRYQCRGIAPLDAATPAPASTARIERKMETGR